MEKFILTLLIGCLACLRFSSATDEEELEKLMKNSGFPSDNSGSENDFTLDATEESLAEAGTKNCIYSCPKDTVKIKDFYHKPKVDGCTSSGFKFDFVPSPAMVKCCDSHDECYGTCDIEKAECDKKFRDCLNTYCARRSKKELCEGVSRKLILGVAVLGCKDYKMAQISACNCHDIPKDFEPYKSDL